MRHRLRITHYGELLECGEVPPIIERFIRSCGLGRPEGTNEPLDHISSELELLSYLAHIAAGAQPASGCISVDSLPGGSAQTAYETIVSEHACIWMPTFARALRYHSRIPFFRVAARTLCPNKD